MVRRVGDGVECLPPRTLTILCSGLRVKHFHDLFCRARKNFLIVLLGAGEGEDRVEVLRKAFFIELT
jgi:hypothetical protein